MRQNQRRCPAPRASPSELRIITQGSLGLVYQSVGRLREAVACFQAPLDLVGSEADERPDAVATTLGNLGMAGADLGELAQAQDLRSRALNLYRQAGSLNGETNGLTGLASVNAECGRHDEATYQVTLALRIARDIGDRRIECDALVALARSRRLRGESPAARQRGTEAIATAEQIGYGRGVPDALCIATDSQAAYTAAQQAADLLEPPVLSPGRRARIWRRGQTPRSVRDKKQDQPVPRQNPGRGPGVASPRVR